MDHVHIRLVFGDGIRDKSAKVVNDVKLLQQTLKDWGLLSINDIDGQFGQITEAAVKQFQGKHHLDMNGIVD
jgi:peptidoglycan hydrolase-like protein with peptidoglycan-binding domain